MDFISTRYGQLPSKVLSQGSSLDVLVGELAVGYELYTRQKMENDHKGLPTVSKKYSTQELQSMLAKVKVENDSS